MNETQLNILWNATSDSIGEMLESFVKDYPEVVQADWDDIVEICKDESSYDLDWKKLARKLKARHIQEPFARFVIHKYLEKNIEKSLLFNNCDPDATKDVELHMAETIEHECEWSITNYMVVIRQIMEYEDCNWIF